MSNGAIIETRDLRKVYRVTPLADELVSGHRSSNP